MRRTRSKALSQTNFYMNRYDSFALLVNAQVNLPWPWQDNEVCNFTTLCKMLHGTNGQLPSSPSR